MTTLRTTLDSFSRSATFVAPTQDEILADFEEFTGRADDGTAATVFAILAETRDYSIAKIGDYTVIWSLARPNGTTVVTIGI